MFDFNVTLERYQENVASVADVWGLIPVQWRRQVTKDGRQISNVDLVYVALMAHRNNKTGYSKPTIHLLKAETGLGQKAIEESIGALEDAKWLQTISETGRYGRVRFSYNMGMYRRRDGDRLFDAAFIRAGYFSTLSAPAKRLWILLQYSSAMAALGFSDPIAIEEMKQDSTFYQECFDEVALPAWRGVDPTQIGYVDSCGAEDWADICGVRQDALNMAMGELRALGIVRRSREVVDLYHAESGWFVMRRPDVPTNEGVYSTWIGGIGKFHDRVDQAKKDRAFRQKTMETELNSSTDNAHEQAAPCCRSRRRKEPAHTAVVDSSREHKTTQTDMSPELAAQRRMMEELRDKRRVDNRPDDVAF